MPNHAEKGFTLIELLVGMAIFLIITALTYEIFIKQFHFIALQQKYNQMDSTVETALRIISTDIALTGSDPTGTILFDQGTGPSALRLDPDGDNVIDEIEIRSDRNADGTFAGGEDNEDVLIRINPANNRLIRNGLTLVDGVESLDFRCRDQEGNLIGPAGNSSLVSLIEIRLRLKATAGGKDFFRDYMTASYVINR